MNERVTRHVAVNVLENWQPVVPESAKAARWVVLANMSPDNQIATLEQCEPGAFVVADTMDLWITIASERLHDVLARVDLLVINDSEAREFAGTDNLILAGERLRAKGPRYVVIKLGEHGAFLFGEDQHHFFSCAAFPLKEVNDPTGAGDTFLGGLAGHLAWMNAVQPTFEQLKAAVVRGTIMASFTCEAFSTRRLEALTDDEIARRLELFRTFTTF
jgi:sugar/nucleoside kinase (ribokinase family)